MRTLFLIVLLISAIGIGVPFLIGEGDACKARAGVAADRFEGAMDVLSDRYPLRIGLLRSLFNQGGQADALTKALIIEALGYSDEEEGTHPMACVRDYYILHIHQGEIEAEIVRELEAAFGLNEAHAQTPS